ncbi:iduronate 2-sulfatase isoform X2 [Leptopilina heterotoma]|uniref:iduronate 2-sulfatase isoform X2 n=1 Tax=Leptopilina heterotoma TaxID=63436 RepID=UPI001CA7FCD1|nr:iduronate 2-sulfatase isoform X2 [Leptopilina heterotoma]
MLLQLFSVLLLISTTIGRPNFLFIIVDDLRPALGCYGDKNAYTPNIDSLAEKSTVFTHAFAQQSLCAPSRNSMLTSRRPDTLRLYDFYSYWRKDVGNFTTLPQHLKNNGYTTMSIGKVFHPGISSNGSDDSPFSWTEKPFHPFTDRYKDAPVCQNSKNKSARNLVCPVQLSMIPNNTLPDMETLNAASSFLQLHSQKINPFFLAVGFQKPHIPLKYPEEFLIYHPLDKFSIPDNYQWSINVSSVAYNPWTDLRIREDVNALNLKFPWQKIPFNFAIDIIQSYYAAVTYIDHQIGKLLDELRKYNLEENTVIILTSDHGWSLGEHSEWAKYSNFEVALKVPLLISIPTLSNIKDCGVDFKKINESEGKIESVRKKNCNQINELVELVDIFPTIAELANTPIKTCIDSDDEESNLCTEGYSMLPLIEASKTCEKLNWKKAVFSQYPRPGLEPSFKPNSDKPRLKEINIMGYTVRTKRFRYTAWISFSSNNFKPIWKKIVAEELYDHTTDPKETVNQVKFSKFHKIKKKLKKILLAGWRQALP